MFIAKCHGLEVKEEKKSKPMSEKDWKLFAETIKRTRDKDKQWQQMT